MNRYAPWKYAVIAIAFVVALVYAMPNLFGEVPAIEVSGKRTTVKVDDEVRGNVEKALADAHVAFTGSELIDGKLRLRFADTDTQLKARDIALSHVDAASYGVALNLVANSPTGCRHSAPSPCTWAWTCAAACISCCRWT